MSEVHIVRLSPDDWELWRDMRAKGIESDPMSFGSTIKWTREKPEEDWRKEIADGYFYAAMQDGRAVGIASACPEKGIKNRHVVYIYSVFVSSESRGQGVGKALIQKIIDDQEANPDTVKLMLQAADTPAATSLYESMGFEKLARMRKQIQVDGVYADEWLMERFIR